MLTKFKALPHFMLFRRSSVRSAIEKDMLRWLEVYQPDRPVKPLVEALPWLLDHFPEFRNLFYARLGRYSSPMGRILLFFALSMHPAYQTPGFAEPINIGPGLFIYNGFGCVIGPKSMGEGCWLNPGCTIGYKDSASGLPVIGNHVFIGAGAKILGPVNIGDHAVIGANAVVIKDVPPNTTVAGIPARIIKSDGVRV